jgi:predicted transcriptional regulator
MLWEYGSSDIVTHMKTTVEISDDLAEAVRRLAAEENTTLRALIEAGLRRILEERQQVPSFRLRDASFAGEGLQAEFREVGWERFREAAYGTERGG